MSENKYTAAIDVGSNAIRFILVSYKNGKMITHEKIREPIRLGQDVFINGHISSKNITSSVTAFKRFKKKMLKYNLSNINAVATSAVREAQNGKLFKQKILEETGIDLKVINFKLEGKFIQKAVSTQVDLNKKKNLIMDIGGGSVEFIYSKSNKVHSISSFPYGTVRSLKESSEKNQNLDSFIDKAKKDFFNFIKNEKIKPDIFIGTGGNLVCLGVLRSMLLEKKNRFKIHIEELQKIISILDSLGYSGRINKLRMKRNRADVIIPAAYITLLVMELLKCKTIMLPNVGLKEGLLLSSLNLK